MEFIFKHFGKFWLAAFIFILVFGVSAFGLLAWAVIKLVTHFTA